MISRLTAWLEVQRNRGRVYRVLGVVGGIAVATHWLTSGELATVLTDVGLVLGVGGNGLASVHTPTQRAAARKARRAEHKKKG